MAPAQGHREVRVRHSSVPPPSSRLPRPDTGTAAGRPGRETQNNTRAPKIGDYWGEAERHRAPPRTRTAGHLGTEGNHWGKAEHREDRLLSVTGGMMSR